jgi:hypothetical protein
MRISKELTNFRGDRMQYKLSKNDDIEYVKRSFIGFKERELPIGIHADEYRRVKIFDTKGNLVCTMYQLKDNYFRRMAIGIKSIKL